MKTGLETRSGIYRIRNTVTNLSYIGQAVNLARRKQQHFYALRKGNHYNKYLQYSYNHSKEEDFVFEILLYCESFELTKYEQWFVDTLDPGCNILKECVNSPGSNKETRDKCSSGMSVVMRGRHRTIEKRMELMSRLRGEPTEVVLETIYFSAPRCAICGKKTRYDQAHVCEQCTNTHCSNGSPDWVKELVRIESADYRLHKRMELAKQALAITRLNY